MDPHQIRNTGNKKNKNVRAVDSIDYVLSRIQTFHCGECVVYGLSELLTAVEIKTAGMPGTGIEDDERGETVQLTLVLSDVTFRTQHALLLARKKSEADGAAWNYAQVVERSRQIDHHGGVDAVIFRARSQIPGIEMRSNEHDLVRLLASANFRDYVFRLVCGRSPVGNG